jgi:hypothetical protein
MGATAIYLTFGFLWLCAGVYEWRIATLHAKLYDYKPDKSAAYYWLIAGAVFLFVGALCLFGG